MSAAYARRWICEERLANLISDLIVPRLVPGRFKGSDKSRIVDGTEIHSVPVRAVEEAIAFVQKHALHAAEIGELHRKERWSLPPVAVREAVINAVVHTDYAQRGAPLRISIFDDRLEVENPGLLPFGLTVDDLPHGVSKLRNRVIGRVFHALGLVQQWGSGIQRMTAGCGEHPPRQDRGAGPQDLRPVPDVVLPTVTSRLAAASRSLRLSDGETSTLRRGRFVDERRRIVFLLFATMTN
jgi:ATP-dependent DNA helicase recG-like protein